MSPRGHCGDVALALIAVVAAVHARGDVRSQ
jgi:hypothetical protein